MEFFYDKNKPRIKEKSYGRLAMQQRMRLAMAFLNPLRPIINETWLIKGEGNKSRAFGLALKKLIQDGVEGQYPTQYILPNQVSISMGTLSGVAIQDVVLSNHLIDIYFSSEENPSSRDGDEVILVAYSPELGMGGKNDVPCYRRDGHLHMELPIHFSESPFHLYLYVKAVNGKQYSKSSYLGYFENAR